MTYAEKHLIEMEFYAHAIPYLASTQGLTDTEKPNTDCIVQIQVPSTSFNLMYPRGPDQQHLTDQPQRYMNDVWLLKRVLNVISTVVNKIITNVIVKGLAYKFSGYLGKACARIGLVHNPQ